MKHLLIAACASMFAVSAHAQDAVTVDTNSIVLDEASNWTGPYAGASLSSSSLSLRLSAYGYSETLVSDSEGGVGIFAGYMLQASGKHMVGFDIDYSETDVVNQTRGRLIYGYDANKYMPYVTLGAGTADFTDGIDSQTENGMTFGVGVAYKLGAKTSISFDYSYLMLNDLEKEMERYEEAEEGYRPDVNIDLNTLQLRVAYHF